MCTSTLQTRLLQTLDTLDTVTTNYSTQLSALEALLGDTQIKLSAEQEENYELKEVILVLLETVDRCNGIFKGWPYARMKVSGRLAEPVKNTALHSTMLPMENASHSPTIVKVLREQLAAERQAHARTKLLVADLEAKIARREAEIQCTCCNDTTLNDLTAAMGDAKLRQSGIENVLGSPLQLKPTPTKRRVPSSDSSLLEVGTANSETICTTPTRPTKFTSQHKFSNHPLDNASPSKRLGSSRVSYTDSTISPYQSKTTHHYRTQIPVHLLTHTHLHAHSHSSPTPTKAGPSRYPLTEPVSTPLERPVDLDDLFTPRYGNKTLPQLAASEPSQSHSSPVVSPLRHHKPKISSRTKALLNLRRQVSVLARNLDDLRETSMRISAVASESPRFARASHGSSSIDHEGWSYEYASEVDHGEGPSRIRTPTRFHRQSSSLDVYTRSPSAQSFSSPVNASPYGYSDDDLYASDPMYDEASYNDGVDADEEDPGYSTSQSAQSMELCSPLPVSNPAPIRVDSPARPPPPQGALALTSPTPAAPLKPHIPSGSLQESPHDEALDEAISPLALSACLGAPFDLEGGTGQASTSPQVSSSRSILATLGGSSTLRASRSTEASDEDTIQPLPVPPPRTSPTKQGRGQD